MQARALQAYVEEEKRLCAQIETELRNKMPDAELRMEEVRQRLQSIAGEMQKSSERLVDLKRETKQAQHYVQVAQEYNMSNGG